MTLFITLFFTLSNRFVILFLSKFKSKNSKKKRFKMTVKSKLNSDKSKILRAMQESHISEKDYAFINQEVGRCSK